MVGHRDATCPYFGFHAFDEADVRQVERDPSFFVRQENEQRKLVSEMQHERDNTSNNNDGGGGDDHPLLLQQLERLRGGDDVARVALFMVYHVTRIRRFAAQHPSVTLIEYQLEDDTVGPLMSQVFHVPENMENGKQCWRQTDVNPKKEPELTEST
jgi:hypothetical protein